MKVGTPAAKATKSILKRPAAAALAALRRPAAAPGPVSVAPAHLIVSALSEEEDMVMRSRALSVMDALRKVFPSRFVDRSVAVGGPLRTGPDGGRPTAKAGFSAKAKQPIGHLDEPLCHGCGGVIPWREVVVCRGCHNLFHLWCKVAHLPVCPWTPVRHLPAEIWLGQAPDRLCRGRDPEDSMVSFSAIGCSNEMRKSADECHPLDMDVTPYPLSHTGPSIDFLGERRLEIPTAILQSGKNVEKSLAQYMFGLAALPQPTWTP